MTRFLTCVYKHIYVYVYKQIHMYIHIRIQDVIAALWLESENTRHDMASV